MKIAYIAHWDVSRESGVLKKIESQMRAWINEGNEVKLFAASPRCELSEEMRDLPVDIVKSGRARNHVFRTRILTIHALSWNPDMVYLRFAMNYPSLGSLMAYVPTFLEINTDDMMEYKLSFPKLLYVYHLLTREGVLRKAHGMIFATHEIASRYGRYNKPGLVIGNGIDLNRYHRISAPQNPSPRIIFLGNPRPPPWHGVDKIIFLASNFPKWRFDVVGIDLEDVRVKIPSNVMFHGQCSYADYRRVLVLADVAIGTLSLHKMNMNEASPLKVREYLAHGLPIIIGYCDTDFPEPQPYILELPNTPNNVAENISLIEQFVHQWRGKRVRHDVISHLHVGVKERLRLSFFREVLSRADTG